MIKPIQMILCAGILSITAALSAQTIPPYTQDNYSTPDSIPSPIDREKDTPCLPGCYAVDGGVSFYYRKGDYYNSDRTSTQYATIRDSKAAKFAPWGIRLDPSAEFFMAKNFAVGGIAEFGYDKLGADSRIQIGVGPLFSFYFPTKKGLIPYISVFGLYEHTNDYWASTKSMYWTDQAMKAGVKLGTIFMLTRQGGVFIDGRFTYEYHLMSEPPLQKQKSSTAWNAGLFVGYKYFMF